MKHTHIDQSHFLYPRSRYHGRFTPERVVFNANLQEFSQRIGYICALETGGNLRPEQAYAQIEQLWEQLKCSGEQLGIGTQPG